MKKWILETLSDDLFTDRADWLAYLFRLGTDLANNKPVRSRAIVGLRRLGKTELFKRVYNQLFFEQEVVVPVFWTYEGKKLLNPSFSQSYFTEFLRQYFAFKNKAQATQLLRYQLTELFDYGLNHDRSEGIIEVIERFRPAQRVDNEAEMLTIAINAPRLVAAHNEEPIIVFVDEFQEILKVRDSDGTDPNCIGNYQEAVESLRCPHIITGSAKSLILYDILRDGPLFGRFLLNDIKGLEGYFAQELVDKWCKRLGVTVCEEMAAELGIRCGGNPYYIELVIQQAHRQGKSLDNVENLNQTLVTDLIKGGIWAELEKQVLRFITEQNQKGIGKELLYRASKYEVIQLDDMEEMATSLNCRFEEIQGMLSALARADLLEEEGIRGTYYIRVNDPILNEFLKVWCEVKVEHQKKEKVEKRKLREYQKKSKQFDYYKGITVQVYILYMMTKWNQEVVEGKDYFNIDKQIVLPQFRWVDNDRLKHPNTGEAELDVIGMHQNILWLGECKYWTDAQPGLKEVQDFVERKAEIAKKALEYEEDEEIVLWFFSRNGVEAKAEDYIKENGLLYSKEEDLNRLLKRFGVKELPRMV